MVWRSKLLVFNLVIQVCSLPICGFYRKYVLLLKFIKLMKDFQVYNNMLPFLQSEVIYNNINSAGALIGTVLNIKKNIIAQVRLSVSVLVASNISACVIFRQFCWLYSDTSICISLLSSYCCFMQFFH